MKDLQNVVYSDECRFSQSNDSKTMRVWRKANENENPQYFAPKFSNSTSVMFWGSVGPNGVGKLAVCDGKVNAEMYVEILQDCCVYRVPYSSVSLLFRRFVINRTFFLVCIAIHCSCHSFC